MIFNSTEFLVFFPVVLLVYFVLPAKIRYLWLLVSSYYFYMCWNPRYVLLLLFSTGVTWGCGFLMDRIKNKNWATDSVVKGKKICVAVSLFLNLSILFVFKYLDFFFVNLSGLLSHVNITIEIPKVDLLLPVGISFYVFQALGYTIDVYRGEIKAEKNFLRYALFVSFFPQLVAGPIERSKNLLKQLNRPTHFDVDNARNGLLVMAWGLFLKIVVADHIAALINPIYSDSNSYHGMVLMAATMLFAIQIYCDFEGYSQIAIGSALVLGFHINQNFMSPYCALSVQDFWKRWHISLTSWFRDYLYIPLGGNRKGKNRKYVNTMLVFLTSGLWHGANWKYVVWGGLNGFYMVCQEVTEKWRVATWDRLKIRTNTKAFRLLSRIFTFFLVDISWLFFRAESFETGFFLLKRMVKQFRPAYLFSDSFWNMFQSIQNLAIIVISLVVLAVVDYMKYKSVNIREKILEQQIVFRWIIYLALIWVILFWGVYGEGYEQTQFIYFQF